MNSFPENQLENAGGMASFNFVPAYAVSQVPEANDNVITAPVVLNANRQWVKGLFIKNTGAFDENTKDTNGGLTYNYKFTCKYPGTNLELNSTLAEMAQTPIVLDCTDNNGNRRLLGNKNNPLTMQYAFNTKDGFAGRPEYILTFSWLSEKTAPFYNV